MATGSGRRRFITTSALAVAAGLDAGCSRRSLTVYLVRHAEKETPAEGAAPVKDPPLSALGASRADGLSRALERVELRAVYASEFQRTQQTVEPCARSRGLAVEVVPAADVQALVDKVRAHLGGSVLVAGHSNTVPEIAGKLG